MTNSSNTHINKDTYIPRHVNCLQVTSAIRY